MTPNGQAGMKARQPLHTSCWMMTLSRSVRMSACVGHTSRQPACWQCLQESLIMYQAVVERSAGMFSMKRTCRQLVDDRWPVLSYESPVKLMALSSPSGWTAKCSGSPSSSFHSLQATWQALQPMQTEVSTNMPLGIAHLPGRVVALEAGQRDLRPIARQELLVQLRRRR